MAETFDAAERLSQGLPSVDNVQQYVTGCGSVGYSQTDLTSHPAQVREWYTTEDGLDLRSLEADCQSLTAAEAAANEAWARQAEQTGVLSAAWQGTGAEASRALLRRHGDAAAQTVGALRSAAEAIGDLRDRLWRAVDTKVVAAQSIDDRTAAQRAEWLAAAKTVATGVGDRAAASELIDQQVKPFVDNDIRHDWVTAMRAAIAAINDAFDTATAELSSLPEVAFDVPGDLGPSWTPPPPVEEAPVAQAPRSVESAGPPAASPPAAALTAAPMASAPPTAPAGMPPTAPAAMPPPTGGMGGGMGMPDVGGGLSGIGQQLADAFGGLLGSTGDALGDLPGADDATDADEPEDVEELLDENENEDEDDEKAEEEEAVDDESAVEEEADEAGAEATAEPVEPECQPPAEPLAGKPPVEPVATPAPVPVPPEPLPPAPPPAPLAAETPCDIAADELPQVGE